MHEFTLSVSLNFQVLFAAEVRNQDLH